MPLPSPFVVKNGSIARLSVASIHSFTRIVHAQAYIAPRFQTVGLVSCN